MKTKITLFFLLIQTVCFSQIYSVDSLNKLLKLNLNDTTRIDLLNTISKQYYRNGNIDLIIPSANNALILSQKINYKKGICSAFKNIGTAYKVYGENYKALNYFQKALIVSKEINDKKSEADLLGLIGLVYESQDDYKQALKLFFQSLKIREGIKDINGIANSYNAIGIIYANQSNYNIALEYYFKGTSKN